MLVDIKLKQVLMLHVKPLSAAYFCFVLLSFSKCQFCTVFYINNFRKFNLF